MSKDEAKPKYNNTLAIRGILNKSPENIDIKNIAFIFRFKLSSCNLSSQSKWRLKILLL